MVALCGQQGRVRGCTQPVPQLLGETGHGERVSSWGQRPWGTGGLRALPCAGQLSLQQPTVPPGLAVSGQWGGAQGWEESKAGSYPAEHSTLMGMQVPPGLLSQHHAIPSCPPVPVLWGHPAIPLLPAAAAAFQKVLGPK